MTDAEKLNTLIRIINGFEYVIVCVYGKEAKIVIDGHTYVSLEDAEFFNSIYTNGD